MDDDKRKYYFDKSGIQRYSHPRKNNHTVPHATIDRATYSTNSKYSKQPANSSSKHPMKNLYSNNIAVLSNKIRKLRLSGGEDDEDEDDDDNRDHFCVEDDERGTEEIGIESSDKDEEDEEDYEVDEENDFPSGLHDNQERIRYLLRSNNQKFDKYGNTGNRSHYQAPIMKNFQQIPSALAATNRYHRYSRHPLESHEEEIRASGSRFKKPNSMVNEDRLMDSLHYRRGHSNRRPIHKMEDTTTVLGDGKGECLRCGGNKSPRFVKKAHPRHKIPSHQELFTTEEEDKEICESHSYPRHKYYFDKIPEMTQRSKSRQYSKGMKLREDELALINDEIPHEYSRKCRQSMQQHQSHKPH